MPIPIRPVREIEENIPSTLRDGGFSYMGLSDIQIKMLGLADVDKEAAKKTVIDSRDADTLHEIWKSQDDKKLTMAEDIKKIKISIPEKINESDVIRMKTNGLVVGAGREVSLTSRGEKVLKDKILAQPSVYFLNRTKEKFDFGKEANNKSKFTKITEIK